MCRQSKTSEREEIKKREKDGRKQVSKDHIRQFSPQAERKKQEKKIELVHVVPRMRLLIPSRLTNTLSMSSLPVKSSAITYKLGLTTLAASSMA